MSELSEIAYMRYAKSGDYVMREAVAYDSKTPTHILDKLSEDENDGVRIGVAHNKNTPMDTLRILAEDDDWWARVAARGTIASLR